MKNWLKRLPDIRRPENRYLWYILVLPAFVICFFLLERFGPENYWVSYIPLDDKIPFCEYFVLPYVLWYPGGDGTDGLRFCFHDALCAGKRRVQLRYSG